MQFLLLCHSAVDGRRPFGDMNLLKRQSHDQHVTRDVEDGTFFVVNRFQFHCCDD